MIAALASRLLAEGGRVTVLVAGREVALARVSGVVYGLANTCPHRGGALGQGELQGHHLYCPLHAWCFDVRTGEGFFPRGARVATHRVEDRDGQLWVDPAPIAPPGSF